MTHPEPQSPAEARQIIRDAMDQIEEAADRARNAVLAMQDNYTTPGQNSPAFDAALRAHYAATENDPRSSWDPGTFFDHGWNLIRPATAAMREYVTRVEALPQPEEPTS